MKLKYPSGLEFIFLNFYKIRSVHNAVYVSKAYWVMKCVVRNRKVVVDTMVDTNRDNKNTIASKGILKRRIFVRNDKTAQTTLTKLLQDSGDCCIANMCKRCVTFDETITIKNDEDLVVRKPLKLELVIDNWKSNGTETHTETIQPDPGIVKRLVEEFNTIEEPLTNSSKIESTSIKEDEPMKSCTNIPLCEALKTVNLTTDDQ